MGRSLDSGLPELTEYVFMNTTAKIQHKGQVTIPTSVRRQAVLSQGDLVNFAFQRGKIVITPRLVIDRAQFPNADDEYTPAQRRIIDARLAQARKGPHYGPFNTADEMIADMKERLKKSDAANRNEVPLAVRGRGPAPQRRSPRQHFLAQHRPPGQRLAKSQDSQRQHGH